MKIFEKNIEGGQRLGYNELKKLQPEYKAVYKKCIIRHGEKIDVMVDDAQDKALDQIDDLADVQMQIQDIKDDVEQQEAQINK